MSDGGKGSAPRKQQDTEAYAEGYDRIFGKKAKQVEPAVGSDGKPWPMTFDGMAWATEFHRRYPTVPLDEALSWFCNALMRGFDEAHWRTEQAAAVPSVNADT